MIMYQIVSGTYSLEGSTYTSFGIQCGTTVIEDISLDKAAVAGLVALCNKEELDPCHLPDVVSDFLVCGNDRVVFTQPGSGETGGLEEPKLIEPPLTARQSRAYERLKEMMQAYLVERDVEKALSYYTEDVQSIGTGVQEVAFNREGLRLLLEDEIHQDPIPFDITFEKVRPLGGAEEGDVYLYTVIKVRKLLSTGITICVEMRQTILLCERDGFFYIRAVHVSVPAAQQKENEYYPIQYGEQTLKERRTKLDGDMLELMSETLPGGLMGGYDEPGFPLYFINDRMLKLLGYSYENFVSGTDGMVINCIHPSDRERVTKSVDLALQRGETYTITYRMLKKDGSDIWVYDKGRRIVTEDGRKAIISVCLDISTQVRAESELSFIAQSRIGGIFKARISDGFPVLYANECYYQIHGYTQEEFRQELGNEAAKLVYPDDLPIVSAKIDQTIRKKKKNITLKYRVIRRDGKISWLHASAGLTYDSDGIVLSGMVINIDEWQIFEQQLEWSEKKFQIAIEQTKINVWEYDLQTRSILQTRKSYQFFGMAMTIPDVPHSMIANKVVHPNDAANYMELYEKLHRGEKTADAVVRLRATDGKYYWEKINYTNIFDENGMPVRAVAVSEDITAQKEAEQRFFQEEHLREMLSADVLVSAKINLTQNRVLRIWSNFHDFESLQNIASYDDLCTAIRGYIANKGDVKRFLNMFRGEALTQSVTKGEENLYGEFRCINGRGQIVWCAFHLAVLRDPDTSEQYAFCYVRDINERKKTELALQERAERDALTGLYNRQTAESMISQRLSQREAGREQCAFFVIDMDDFKQVNDRFGHHFGDQILQEIGRILRAEAPGNSISGRVGGDEFVIFMEEVPNRDWAVKTAAKLCGSLSVSYSINGEPMRISASVGVAVSEREDLSFQDMFQQADSALYDAKYQGKARYTCFDGRRETPGQMCFVHDGCVIRQHSDTLCMLDELDDSILVIDEKSHDILFMSNSAQREFGIEDYHGQKCYEILQGFTRPCIFCQNHLPGEHGFKTWENTNARLHKRHMIRDKIIQWDGRRARLEIFTDLCKYEERLNSKAEGDRVLLECASLLLVTGALGDAIRGVLENLGKFYRADRAYFVRAKGVNSLQIAPQDWCAPGIGPVQNENERLENSDLNKWMKTLSSKRVTVFQELEQMQLLFPEKYKVLKEKQVDSFAAVALMEGDSLVGYIGIENPRRNLDNTTMLQSFSYFMQNEISKRSMQEHQKFIENHDMMTELLNWQGYSQACACMQPDVLSSLGIVAAEINQLHSINQEYGNRYGDQMILDLAAALREEFGEPCAFRISGASFVVMCQDIAYESFLSQLERLRARMERIYPGRISLGYSWADEDIQPALLMNCAREILTITQENEKAMVPRNATTRAIRLRHLQNAIQEGRFQIYLQPKAEVDGGAIKGAEALVRYSDEIHGVVPPIKFIPQLERENNIRYIDFFVLEEVCVILNKWKRQGFPLFPISVNFSRCTLMEEDVVGKINQVADRYGVDRSLLEIEITESMGEVNRRFLTEIAGQIVQAGYHLFLDDFGSEYSNISILTTVPINGLKFDKSVINDLYSNETTRLLIENLIHVCRQMGIDSIAEGVEEPEQLEILKECGCTYAQGYIFNKPLPVRDFERRYLNKGWELGDRNKSVLNRGSGKTSIPSKCRRRSLLRGKPLQEKRKIYKLKKRIC